VNATIGLERDRRHPLRWWTLAARSVSLMRPREEPDAAARGGSLAYDHQMAFCGDPSPRLVALVDKIGVDATWFTFLQALEPASAD
jgi:hypothetical protein